MSTLGSLLTVDEASTGHAATALARARDTWPSHPWDFPRRLHNAGVSHGGAISTLGSLLTVDEASTGWAATALGPVRDAPTPGRRLGAHTRGAQLTHVDDLK
jgi:hypothetical protein